MGSDERPRGVLYLASPLRDVNRQVALFALVAFVVGGVALFGTATVTMGFLRRALLLPLSRIIEADNAARRGDAEGVLVDEGDIPDDEVGAIMRSRNHLFEAMTRAQADLDQKNAELKAQREELRVWGRELEQLVQDKTAALLRAREVLHQTEKLAALGRLAANVAHEINNPLACIAGYAEEAQADLEDGADAEELGRSLKTIEEQAFRCKDILKRLLGLARTDAPRLEDVALADLIRETVALSERTSDKRGVELRLELPAGDETIVRSDAGALQQVILNLVENAVDAAAVGAAKPGWVSVGLAPGVQEVCVTVRDSGRGIPPDLVDRIFDPFYTTKPVGRGTGLGLAISQSLLERLGGRIAVASDGEQGATFSVWVPREPSTQALRRPTARSLQAVDGTRTADGSDLIEEQLRVVTGAADPDAPPIPW
jgi:signal transduction histidine kinase